MASSRILRRIFAFAFLATVASASAAEAPSAAAAKDAAKASVADARKGAQEQINAKRDKMIADQESLQKQLGAATAEKRQEILAKLAEQKKKFEETMSALAKQIRDDERQRRQNAAAAGKR